MVLVCPSVLSADFTCLGEDCARVLNAGADMIHFDVMDGHFVDNLSFGLPVLETLHHALPQAVMDVHLMISHPLRFVHRFAAAGADYITVHDEVVDDTQDLVIRDPDATWKQKTMTNFRARELQVPIFKNGELVYDLPSLPEIQAYCKSEVATLWPEVRRFDYTHNYYVDLSDRLLGIKTEMLGAAHNG